MSSARTRIVALTTASLVAMFCFSLGANANDRGSLTSDGRDRTFELHVPANAKNGTPLPLVLALHGRLGDGHGMALLTHFDTVADEHNFIVVYPDGLHRGWADGRGATASDKDGVSDVNFLAALIHYISTQHKIDASRIYVTGISNGGFMTNRLACELSATVAAVGTVAATLGQETANACRLAKPVPIVLVQGTKDPIVPIGGGSLGNGGSRGEVLSFEATTQKWVALNGCNNKGNATTLIEIVDDGTVVRRVEYSGCESKAEVVAYTIEGGGHTWPGGKQYLPAMVIGKTSRNLDASETLWEFFERHRRD